MTDQQLELENKMEIEIQKFRQMPPDERKIAIHWLGKIAPFLKKGSSTQHLFDLACQTFGITSPEKINELLDNKKLRDKISKNNIKKSEKYKWNIISSKTLNLYKNLLEK